MRAEGHERAMEEIERLSRAMAEGMRQHYRREGGTRLHPRPKPGVQRGS